MKKIVFCNIMMSTSVSKQNYQSQETSLSGELEVIFPINKLLASQLNGNDDVKVVLLLKQDNNGNAKRCMGEFMGELDSINASIGARIKYEYIESPCEENRQAQEDLLRRIVDKIECGVDVYADVTYGPKPLPILLFAALSFAEKFMKINIKNIIYGKVDFANTLAENPIVFDITSLYYLSSIISSMECKNEWQAKDMLEKILDI